MDAVKAYCEAGVRSASEPGTDWRLSHPAYVTRDEAVLRLESRLGVPVRRFDLPALPWEPPPDDG